MLLYSNCLRTFALSCWSVPTGLQLVTVSHWLVSPLSSPSWLSSYQQDPPPMFSCYSCFRVFNPQFLEISHKIIVDCGFTSARFAIRISVFPQNGDSFCSIVHCQLKFSQHTIPDHLDLAQMGRETWWSRKNGRLGVCFCLVGGLRFSPKCLHSGGAGSYPGCCISNPALC